MAHALLALVAIAMLTGVGAAGVMTHTQAADPNLATVTGTVVSVDWNPHFNVTVEFKIQANDANKTVYEVDLGPASYWAEQHYPVVKVNDTVTVSGTLEDGHDIEVWTISINGSTPIVLRTGGMPAWGQEDSSNPSHEDSSNGAQVDHASGNTADH